MNDKSKKLKAIDAETLLATPLKPLCFVIDGLIPPGLHLLGGSPKIGKSWLMLWMCLKVANGEDLWDHHTNKCTVLYLCLEDTYLRMQNRLFQIADSAPENLYFSIIADQIGSGLQEQITEFINNHISTRLIVIDTLQRVRGISTDYNAYASDYRDISALKELADRYKIALIVVHHLRKQATNDPFLKVSGTTGITGAVDSTMVLEKDNHASNSAKLFITGRDIEYQELKLQFENFVWKCISSEKAEDIMIRKTPNFLFQVVNFVPSKGYWIGSASELLKEIGDDKTPINTVTKLLNQFHSTFLAENKIIYEYTRTGKGRYIHLSTDVGCDSCDSDISAGN